MTMPRQAGTAEASARPDEAPSEFDARKKAKVTVLICALNEEESLAHVLPRIPGWVNEVLLVDGHSTDDTVAVAKKLQPNIRVLQQPGKGKGDALRYGMSQAEGEIIVTLDGDGQTDPGEMHRFVDAIQQGYDFAKGTRFRRPFSRARPIHRILGNWTIALTFNLLFFRLYTDLCSGYNAFRKESIRAIDFFHPDGLADEPLLLARVCKAGLSIVEVAHRDPPRLAGVSKSPSWGQGFRAIRTVVHERFRR
jgi:glycosyltransferase involved in cell wall biosynthesis